MQILKYLGGLIFVTVVGVGGFLAWAASVPAINPIDRPERSSFDSELINRGELLAKVGGCVVCHTREGGEEYAGGLALPTPFGAIHSTNITPDHETGIGRWSEEAFKRALRQGIDRAGDHLYPAFPYDHFTKLTDDDIKALYVYLMTREPAVARAPENNLPFPVNVRVLLAGWNLLFLEEGGYQPASARDEQWNRGAYLVEGLGHCGACHSPRNVFGAEKQNAKFGGADIEGWHAPALDTTSPAPIPWNADSMVNYLLDGWDRDHGIAAGPMAPVVDELAAISEDDAYAIAAYILSFQDKDGGDREAKATRAFAESREFGGSETPASGPPVEGTEAGFTDGLAVFARVCANCHRAGGQPVPLALTGTVNGPDPRNMLHIIDKGIQPPQGAYGRSMPAFGGSLSSTELADLAMFIRAHFSQAPPWRGLDAAIAEVRGDRRGRQSRQ